MSGLFLRPPSSILLAIAALFASDAVVAWRGGPGEPALRLATAIGLVLLWRDHVADPRKGPEPEGGEA